MGISLNGHDGHFVYTFVICTQRRQPNFQLVYLGRTVSISALRGWSQGGLEKMDRVSHDTQSLPCSADVASTVASRIFSEQIPTDYGHQQNLHGCFR
jgi:hypothetical protein